MKRIYDFLGGRKMTVFYLLIVTSGSLWFFNRDIEAPELFQFWEWITGMLIVGNVSAKFSKGEK